MSASKKSSKQDKSGQGRGVNRGPGGPRFVKKQGPQKLHLDRANDLTVVQAGGPLKGAFGFMILIPGQKPQMGTFHHPIGRTPLSEDDWVLTPTGDIPDLLSRQEDPHVEARKKRLDDDIIKPFITAGFLKEDPKGDILYWDGTNRTKYKKEYISNEGTPPDPNYHDEVVKLEAAISAVRKAQLALIESELSRWETKSGIQNDRPQKAVRHLKGMSTAEAASAVQRNISSFSGDVRRDREIGLPNLTINTGTSASGGPGEVKTPESPSSKGVVESNLPVVASAPVAKPPMPGGLATLMGSLSQANAGMVMPYPAIAPFSSRDNVLPTGSSTAVAAQATTQ